MPTTFGNLNSKAQFDLFGRIFFGHQRLPVQGPDVLRSTIGQALPPGGYGDNRHARSNFKREGWVEGLHLILKIRKHTHFFFYFLLIGSVVGHIYGRG